MKSHYTKITIDGNNDKYHICGCSFCQIDNINNLYVGIRKYNEVYYLMAAVIRSDNCTFKPLVPWGYKLKPSTMINRLSYIILTNQTVQQQEIIEIINLLHEYVSR